MVLSISVKLADDGKYFMDIRTDDGSQSVILRQETIDSLRRQLNSLIDSQIAREDKTVYYKCKEMQQ